MNPPHRVRRRPDGPCEEATACSCPVVASTRTPCPAVTGRAALQSSLGEMVVDRLPGGAAHRRQLPPAQPGVGTWMVAARITQSSTRRPPPCGRVGAGGTTRWSNFHSSSGPRRGRNASTSEPTTDRRISHGLDELTPPTRGRGERRGTSRPRSRGPPRRLDRYVDVFWMRLPGAVTGRQLGHRPGGGRTPRRRTPRPVIHAGSPGRRTRCASPPPPIGRACRYASLSRDASR